MNKKGMTLVEIVVTILILSIASIMLTSGFSAVVRVFGKASEYKNASDIIFAYAENKEMNDRLMLTNNMTELTIKSSDVTIKEKIKFVNAIDKENEDVTLRILNMEAVNAVFASAQYINVNTRMNEKLMPQYEARLKYFINTMEFDSRKQSYNDILKGNSYLPDQPMIEWAMFENALLPSKLGRDTSGKPNAYPYYMKLYFPWDYSYADGRDVHHGGILYFLSKSKENPGDVSVESINIVYDPTANSWYYYEDVKVGESKYTLDYFNRDAVMLIDGKSDVVKNVDEFMKHINDPTNGWRKLNIAAEFKIEDPDSFWPLITN